MNTIDLPAAVAAYIDAKNRGNVDEMLLAFAADAVARDEGEDYRGSAAIREWLEDVTARLRVQVEPRAVTSAGDETIVSAQVSGDFPGSPVMLSYRFVVAGGRIARLSVG